MNYITNHLLTDKQDCEGRKTMDMNKIIRGILYTALSCAIIVAVNYISAMVRGVPVHYDWILIAIESVAIGLIMLFGPDAAQRKKNRERLIRRFTRE